MKLRKVPGVRTPRHGLSQKLFDKLVKLVPFVGCELVIVNKKKEFLMTWRDDKYFHGWHFPGSLLRYRETFKKRINAVAKEKLGVRVLSHKWVDVFNHVNHPREHAVCLIFVCTISGKPKTGKFFRKIPKNTLKHHREYLEKVLKKNRLL